jgi:RimJ/RimL family protein N-acetyltransferase
VTVTGAIPGDLAGLWPIFGLLIETPRLRLRLPREDELPALARAARDIAGPDGPRLQMPWMYGDSPDMERQLMQRHWRALAHWKPVSWHLPLAVFLSDDLIGVQDLWAEEFAVRRSVGTGSWVTRTRQGRGYGTEARAAVLDLAFGHLGAVEALTEYIEGNGASERVSRKLGYVPNGWSCRRLLRRTRDVGGERRHGRPIAIGLGVPRSGGYTCARIPRPRRSGRTDFSATPTGTGPSAPPGDGTPSQAGSPATPTTSRVPSPWQDAWPSIMTTEMARSASRPAGGYLTQASPPTTPAGNRPGKTPCRHCATGPGNSETCSPGNGREPPEPWTAPRRRRGWSGSSAPARTSSPAAATTGRARSSSTTPVTPKLARTCPDCSVTLATAPGTRILLIIENRQAAETICDSHPAIAVIWCHGQPPEPVLDLIRQAAQGVHQVVICPDADLGGIRIAARIHDSLPPGTRRVIVDAGTAAHDRGDPFSSTTRDLIAAAAQRRDGVGAFAAGCLARGYAVEQEAPARAALHPLL